MENVSSVKSASLSLNASQKRNAATQRGKRKHEFTSIFIQWQLLKPWSMTTDKDN